MWASDDSNVWHRCIGGYYSTEKFACNKQEVPYGAPACKKIPINKDYICKECKSITRDD